MMEASVLPDLPVLAEYANMTSISVILFCLLGTTLFIYLFRMTEDLPCRSFYFGGIQQRNMVKVSNPFVVELDDRIKHLKDGLTFTLSTLCPCRVVVIWGPDIQALHKLILLPGQDVRKKVLTNVDDETDLKSLHNDFVKFQTEGKYTVTLPCPEYVSSESLGDMPRTRYPVAIFVFTPGHFDHTTAGQSSREVPQEIERDNTIIGLFAIVHLKDSVITKNSHIIAKYVKTAGIPIYSLQALYVSTGSQSEEETVCNNTESERENPSSTSSNEDGSGDFFTTSTKPEEENIRSRAESGIDSVFEGIDNLNVTSGLKDSQADTSAMSSASVDFAGTSFSSHSRALPEHVDDSDGRQNDVPVNQSSQESFFLSDAMSARNKPLPECVVCQSRPAKCALLPCRHNCVCLGCLKLLEKCPMCRCTLESFFVVTDKNALLDDDSDESDDEDDEAIDSVISEMQRQGIAAQVENFFERVNQMVGFR